MLYCSSNSAMPVGSILQMHPQIQKTGCKSSYFFPRYYRSYPGRHGDLPLLKTNPNLTGLAMSVHIVAGTGRARFLTVRSPKQRTTPDSGYPGRHGDLPLLKTNLDLTGLAMSVHFGAGTALPWGGFALPCPYSKRLCRKDVSRRLPFCI